METIEFHTNYTPEFLETVNNLRKRNKNRWYALVGIIAGKRVVIKAYNTWLQIYTVNGLRCGGVMDNSVKAFNAELSKPFEELQS